MANQFFPKVIKREKGDYVNSKEYNDSNRFLYNDLKSMFGKELALFAKTKILTTLVEASNSAINNIINDDNLDLPTINFNSEFIFPLEGFQAKVDTFFGEIIMNQEESSESLVDELGVKLPYIDIERAADNFVFSSQPDSVSETRVVDTIEDRDLPYMIRVRGISDKINARFLISSPTGSIDTNTIEFVPFPYVGGTELRGIGLTNNNEGYVEIKDPNGNTIDFSKDRQYYYRPMRLVIAPTIVNKIDITTWSDLFLAGSNASYLGVTKISAQRVIYSSVSYIGFKIPANVGKRVTNVRPVTRQHNSYLGTMKLSVYDDIESFRRKNDNVVTEFNEIGEGGSVSLDTDLWVLVKMESEENTSPQLLGFEYDVYQ